MPRTTARSTTTNRRTTQSAAASAKKHGTRISLGSVWEIDHDKLAFAGVPTESSDEYENEQQLLDILPAPEAGMQWVIKGFHNSSDNPKAPAFDLCLQQEPIYRR